MESSSPNQNGPSEVDQWCVLDIEADNRSAVVRVRLSKIEVEGFPNFSTLIRITWAYDTTISEYPDSKDRQKVDRFSDLLETDHDLNETNYLMLVITGLGSKEWSFYTQNQTKFVAALNKCLKDHPKFPIRIASREDKKWTYWREYYLKCV
jgi:hypothetical protein